MSFFSWLKKKSYSSCTTVEKECVCEQVRGIVEKAESNYIHMLIPNRHILGIRLTDMTPIELTISDVAQIMSEKGLCGGRQFIVSNGTTSYGDYILHFICGVAAKVESNTIEYTELSDS